MNKRIGLVLEGGGFRGCYTAGALKWLRDNNIIFEYTVGMSASAAYAYCYLSNEMDALHDISVNAVKDPKFIGLKSLLKCGDLVNYQYLLETYFKKAFKKSINMFNRISSDLEVGLYDMDNQELVFKNKQQYDEDGVIFKACCALPLSSKIVDINGKKYIDGGTDTMIAIKRSLETGHSKNLIIVTKDKNFIRKRNGFITNCWLRLVYGKYKQMLKALDERVERYYSEMDIVYSEEKKGNALLMRPSYDCGVKRFSGSLEQLEEMFQMGYNDMENRKEEIFKFLEI